MTVDLERQLRSALHEEADHHVPLAAPEWSGPIAAPMPQRRGRVVVAAACLVAVIGGALAVAAIRWADHSSVNTVPPALPRGDEFPLVEVAPSVIENRSTQLVTTMRPGSLIVAEVDDGRLVAMYDTISTPDGGRVVEDRCVQFIPGPLYCSAREGDWPMVWPFTRWWVWQNVPESADYVQYEDGDVVLWQRPIRGLAVFPGREGNDEQVDAISADGTVVAHADAESFDEADEAWRQQLEYDNLEYWDNHLVDVAAQEEAEACLAEWGWGDPLQPTASAGDPDTVWDDCLERAQAAATAKFEELGGELVAGPDDDPSALPASYPTSSP